MDIFMYLTAEVKRPDNAVIAMEIGVPAIVAYFWFYNWLQKEELGKPKWLKYVSLVIISYSVFTGVKHAINYGDPFYRDLFTGPRGAVVHYGAAGISIALALGLIIWGVLSDRSSRSAY